MTTMPSDSIDVARDAEAACRWGIRAAWRLSLAWGALVSLLAWTGGAAAMTAVIRGAVTFLVFGLLGWGLNAVMAHAGAHATAEALRRDEEVLVGDEAEAAATGDGAAGAPDEAPVEDARE